VTPILADFDRYWGMRAAELQSAYDHFDTLDLTSMDRADLWTTVKDAYAFHRRAWFIHFEVMYVLTANYLALYGLAEEIGLEGSQVSAFLAGQQTFYGTTDEELWKLAGRARELEVTGPLQHSEPRDMRAQIAALPRGETWLAEFDAFLRTYGQRTEETCRIDTPAWIEDPSPALYAIGTFLSKPAGFDFHAARQQAVAERDAQIEAARRSINGSDLRRFNEALASNQAANFAWWNEEHNYLIDRRAAIPVRRASLELGARLVDEGRLQAPDDIFFVFKPELYAAMEGADGPAWPALAPMIPDRRAYFEDWRRRGPELPTMLGTIPDTVPDPIMIEVFGLSGHFLETLKGGREQATELRGFPAAKGVAEGVARVITSVTEISQVRPGEILVCGGTTTEWTPVFGIIKACVCDTGGSLTHAAIVSREYGIPCVVGTAAATKSIKTGDRVRVDGRQGTVQVFASQP
jgi:pyruvate,water dikinase